MKRDRAWLLSVGKATAQSLRIRLAGTKSQVRIPKRAYTTNTDGWRVFMGTLGKGKPKIQIWLDRFTGREQRKLWACVTTQSPGAISALARRLRRSRWPIRTITNNDTDDGRYLKLTTPLARNEFNRPILEMYSNGVAFFGVYDVTRKSASKFSAHFVERAATFFEEVAEAAGASRGADNDSDVYPQIENRKHVRFHLARERSGLLATDRKARDNYVCSVCHMRFEDVYGKALGARYAEAHHIVPLSKLRGAVRTEIKDLRTVCANCHRMLHRMKGKRTDIGSLRRRMKRHSLA